MIPKHVHTKTDDSITDALPMGILIYSELGDIAYANRAAGKVLGIHSQWPAPKIQALLGLLPHQVAQRAALDAPHHAEEHEWYGPHFVDLQRDEKKRNIRYYIKKQYEQNYESSSLPKQSYLMLCEDVTDEIFLRKKRERYLQMEGMFQLLPALAHEIKNPLAGIQSMVEVLREETTNPQHAEELEVVLEELERIRFLIDRMRLVNQSFWGTKKEEELIQPLKNTFHSLQRRATHANIGLHLQYPECLRISIHPELVRMIVLNLAINALDACTAGAQVDLVIEKREQTLAIVVHDTGKGMKPNVLRRAHEPFFSTKDMGSGIGLALIREAVERCGGHLRIWSKEHKGTQVTVTLPIYETQ